MSFTRTAATPSPSPTTQVQLCVSLQNDETSVQRGQTAQWNLKVWATGGNVQGVKLGLATSPSSQKPAFSFGCAKEGTNSCAIGTVDSGSQPEQLQARVPIAKTATTVKSVTLSVTATGTGVTTPPKAAVPIAVTAPSTTAPASASASASGSTSAAAAGAPGVTTVPTPAGATSALPVGGLPFLNGSGSTLSPGGNASSLFPTLNPSAGAQPPAGKHTSPRTRPVADTLPGDAPVMGAQYAGLGALALAFVLSATRLTIRRRQAGKPGGGAN